MTSRPPATTLARSVVVSGTTQLAARVADLVVNVFVAVAILRHLGPAGNGDYVLVITVVGVAGLFAELGLPKVAVREVSTHPERAATVLGTVTVMRLVGAVGAALVAQGVVTMFGASRELRLAALVASLAFVADALLSVVIVFQARVEQQFEAVARSAGTVTKLAAVVLIVRADGGLVAVSAISVLALAVSAAVANLLGRRRLGIRAQFAPDQVRPLLRAALPVGPAALIGVLYLKLDAALVGLLTDREDLGRYGAAYQPIEYLFLASAVVIQVLFPILARASAERGPTFEQRYNVGLDVLVGAFAALAAVVVATAGPLVLLAYGDAYRPAAAPFALLAVALIFMAANAWQGSTLLAVGRQTRNLAYLSVAVVANVLVDLALIPLFGIVGAAFGTLLTAFGLVAASTAGVARHAGVLPDPRSLGRLVGAAVFTGACAAGLRQLGVGVGGVLALALAVWVAAVAVVGRPVLERARLAFAEPAGALT